MSLPLFTGAKWAKSSAFAALLLVLVLPIYDAMAGSDVTFECGGSVESEVWNLWDGKVSSFLSQTLLQERLLKQGDVYALYDFQTYTHNMVAMARRCERTDRLRDISALVGVAYTALDSGSLLSPGRRWVCHGGSICNDRNRLIDNEVQLCSVQFLGVASSIANALASSKTELGDGERAFVRNTTQIVIEHLLRWSDDQAIRSIQRAKLASFEDVEDGSSALFFTDKPLWMITIYAELAGILQSKNKPSLEEISPTDMARLSRHLSELLQFMLARISLQHDSNGRLGSADLADVDRGYWRLYADNKYAGYEKAEKPVVCAPLSTDKARFNQDVRVPAVHEFVRESIGWDISHARRLVHALDALERNRQALKDVFHLRDGQLLPVDITNAFANTLVARVWNGDEAQPLFANYWSGANGWYRVAYDNGTGACQEGYPPFGLTDSFLTGGYIAWTRYQPSIGSLGQRFYELIDSTKTGDATFVAKYYAGFGKSANAQNRTLSRLMFLPSLVGVVTQ